MCGPYAEREQLDHQRYSCWHDERGSAFHAQLGNVMSEGVHSRKDGYVVRV